MFVRVLVAAAIVLAVMLLVRRARAALDATRKRPAIEAKMLRCAHCGTYFPRGEGIRSDGSEYCSQAHASEGGGS